MRKFLMGLALFTVYSCVSLLCASDRLVPMDDMVDHLMSAYNSQDATQFYRDYAASMVSIATPEAFAALYTGVYMAQYGNYQSRALIPDKTVVIEGSPVALAVYRAVFDKMDPVQVSVNFIQEDGVWKVMQVQMQPLQ